MDVVQPHFQWIAPKQTQADLVLVVKNDAGRAPQIARVVGTRLAVALVMKGWPISRGVHTAEGPVFFRHPS